ncbi:MAG TPA: class I SAM-dependent RNA methyltransferase, partial [Pyrinomonadaceae bacterium]
MSKKYKVGEELELKIEKIVPGGYGLAFAENLTVFVALAAPGDWLKAKIHQLKGKTAFAEIVEIIEPSVDRIEPPCVYFGSCGGCDFQQMNYAAQLAAKVGIIKDCLVRIGKINYEKEIKIIGSPKPFRYRARAQWRVNTRHRKIGYFQRKSHDVIDVVNCPILTEDLQATLTELRETIVWESFWSETVEIESANAGENVSVYSPEIVEPTDELSFDLNGHHYFYDATTFFQGNPYLIKELIETAIAGAGGETAFDLYCGVGLFTLPLAEKFAKVFGVEAGEKASDFAVKNVENARLENTSIVCEDVGEWLGRNESETIDFVLLDPPRAGTEKEVIESILRIKPRRISYVSCEPSTLARDLKILCDNDYKIESITALDLFPQTHHVET